jgi:hypothetical protein
MVLYEPSSFKYTGNGVMFALEFKKDTPILGAEILLDGIANPVGGRFEIDTGCDDCVCLGHQFIAANHLMDGGESGTGSVRRGVGGSAEIERRKLAELRLGSLSVAKPTANFFREGSPAGDGQAGHIGLGALQRFKMIFDYTRKQLILETPS